MEEKGMKQLECTGVATLQLLAICASYSKWYFLTIPSNLPVKTPTCLLRLVFPDNWNVTFTEKIIGPIKRKHWLSFVE